MDFLEHWIAKGEVCALLLFGLVITDAGSEGTICNRLKPNTRTLNRTGMAISKRYTMCDSIVA